MASNRSYYECLMATSSVQRCFERLDALMTGLDVLIRNYGSRFKLFEFLWREDLNAMFGEFMRSMPNEASIKREVERLAKIERHVCDIPDFLHVGPVCLNTESIKTSLRMFAYTWKCKYASVMHEKARAALEACIAYRESVQQRLAINVQTLEQLNDALHLLETLSDMENKIDSIYLPIETTYADLRRFELILTREEIEQVENLRENWSHLMSSAYVVRQNLIQHKRSTLEQELDKQVKTFVVEVIRFRNLFDATGPSVAGIDPYEAIRRLADFKKSYENFDARRKTLDSISILFGLPCKPFPELDKTGEELWLLSQLYKVYTSSFALKNETFYLILLKINMMIYLENQA